MPEAQVDAVRGDYREKNHCALDRPFSQGRGQLAHPRAWGLGGAPAAHCGRTSRTVAGERERSGPQYSSGCFSSRPRAREPGHGRVSDAGPMLARDASRALPTFDLVAPRSHDPERHGSSPRARAGCLPRSIAVATRLPIVSEFCPYVSRYPPDATSWCE